VLSEIEPTDPEVDINNEPHMNEIIVFGIRIQPYTMCDFIEIIGSAVNNDNPTVQSGINASSIVQLKADPDLARAYNNADLINIDGMSMVWALRFLGYDVPERVACPDLAREVMSLAERNNFSLYLLGATEKNLRAAVANIKTIQPKLRISGFRNGYFHPEDEESIVRMINGSKSDILFLGMPSPQKEVFVEKYKSQLRVKYILGVGGFFDILSGSIKRAPVWMQNIGMEWFYRFSQEPKRLFGRYMKGNFGFIRLVLVEKFKKRNETLLPIPNSDQAV
jgi:N-acetylglucosaminyldiphosphoundecaprenol N-acetyl-beta-D-mannosaminyltransferase